MSAFVGEDADVALRLGQPQPVAQHLGKQLVVAVPLPGVVERGCEQVRSLQMLQHILRAENREPGMGI
jgi:hypothetical protein